MPLDLVVIMLGTNDVRSDLKRTPQQIAEGLARLVDVVQGSAGGVLTPYPAPHVLVIVPPRLQDTSRTPINGVMQGARAKSQALADAVSAVLEGRRVPVVDASRFVTIHGVDGVHMTETDHRTLGQAISEEVRRALAKPIQH
jgi:lysophospholipase L1-like esterase